MGFDELKDSGVEVRLVPPGYHHFTPLDLSLASARQCYSGKTVEPKDVTEAQKVLLGPQIFDAGHHTPFTHPHYTFLLRVSRDLAWFLHNQPYYNTEQQSQRYVEIKEASVRVPGCLNESQRAIFSRAALGMMRAYEIITDALRPDFERVVPSLALSNRKRGRIPSEREAMPQKKAQENARYVCPIGTYTKMYFTISDIVLRRLAAVRHSVDVDDELSGVISGMLAEVRRINPDFDRVAVPEIAPQDILERRVGGIYADYVHDPSSFRDFDASLGGRLSLLVDWPVNGLGTVADAARAVMGLSRGRVTDEGILSSLMDPSINRYWLEPLRFWPHSPLMNALNNLSFVFRKRLSHTADSQDQRHRAVPGSRPCLEYAIRDEPDVVVPSFIERNPQALDAFHAAVMESWTAYVSLLNDGVPRRAAKTILPNALAVRVTESGNLLNLAHKWLLRTCLNAQAEIAEASRQEIAQVAALYDGKGESLVRFLGPPCAVRDGVVSPRCTEGVKFCGVRDIWNRWDDPAFVRPY